MRVLMTVALAASLVACGGDGGSSSGGGRAPNEAEGLWVEVVGDGTFDSAITLVLPNDEFWIFHLDSELGLQGMVYGLATASQGMFTSRTAYAYSDSVTEASVTGTYQAGVNLAATIDIDGSTIESSSMYVAAYDIPADMADVETASGSPAWSGTFYIPGSFSESFVMDVDLNGNITGSIDEECQITGTITPRADVNVFDISATFESASDVACTYDGETLPGIAIVTASGDLFGALHGNDGHIAYAVEAEQQLLK